MARYNLTTVRPKGFLHSDAFVEVKDSLAWSLAALGHEPALTENAFSASATNIIFGAELLSEDSDIPAGSIIYNLEQPTHPRFEIVKSIAHRAACVWEYSRSSLSEWQSAGIPVRHVPIGYVPTLTRIPAGAEDIDVLFYGNLTERRLRILTELKESGLEVVATDHIYGGGRDNLISRAKIILNLHQDGHSKFEIVRCSYLFANRKCVVSETSLDQSEYAALDQALEWWPFEELSDRIWELIHICPGVRKIYGRIAFEKFSVLDYVRIVEAALDGSAPTVTDARLLERYAAACREGDMAAFAPWLRDHAHGNILEIGTRYGASTSAFLLGVQQRGGHVYSLDIADCSHLFPGHPQWTFIRGNSHSVQAFGANGSPPSPIFDIILIDGDHTREGFRDDLTRYWPFLKPGGLMLCHDIAPETWMTREEHPESDYPSCHLREELAAFCAAHGLTHEELPGRFGMGVVRKP